MNYWRLKDPSKGHESLSSDDNFQNSIILHYPCSSNNDCTYYQSVLLPGVYKFKVWGAEGGDGLANGAFSRQTGKGGYSIGAYIVNQTVNAYVFVGGKGEDATDPSTRPAKGGYNGGGDSPQDTDPSNNNDAGGGVVVPLISESEMMI
ncbi:hypothetical protein TVAG_239750 [Trichomonas vaginalis G3]|uniref:receptor protein-tyrosine kinase n=1 Tax=Trichomonas vaginalis (strain ATCC PRA-98 / G3) TaxID=412133 RepID=A2EFB8_TRIV3|nr:glycine-rich protein family [Trichomonas vaginalis G3]EAY08615.1 hypothetical protein TVAG_239750 [Trichomonas vaginalis G3]KAI5536729.1 glycine-rich protein family [Trichomonas vaginalis G3]|eukprot:XP_001320838.1 hypothetical protein [Trichomonas vaginalis G3]